MTHNKRWQIAAPITPEADANLKRFPPILRQILFNRGYSTESEALAFLHAETNFNTDPFQMLGMDEAVERIRFAIDHGEPIAIYGDYDVDGVTATALMVQALRSLGAEVKGYIPNRFEEGYGLNNDALTALKEEGIRLVISVDCGIRSPNEAHHARTIGLDLIISDHHHPADGPLPPACAVINPKQPGDPYPDKDLAGVGIAYKIIEALFSKATSPLPLDAFHDLVALGTVADLAPLTGENRALVHKGLRALRETRRQGLFSLASVANLSPAKLTASHIGFALGPRLNAAGRLKEALAAFELLITNDVFIAGQLAQQLDLQNRERQRITREIQAQAEQIALRDDPESLLLFAADETFNPGVIGLAASRLVESYYRPAVVAAKGPEETRGSCRSIPEFHITEALDQCADLLVRHGGHAAAAGFTVKNENLPELVSRLKAIAAEKLKGQELRPTLRADAVIPLAHIRPEVHKLISYLEPTGYGNPEVVFVSRNVRVKNARPIGNDGAHLKLTLQDEQGVIHDAVAWRMGHLAKEMPPLVDILYTYEINEYNGHTGYQLNLKDIKPAGRGD
jgi:single-stranded-DNA-specific exonuclease